MDLRTADVGGRFGSWNRCRRLTSTTFLALALLVSCVVSSNGHAQDLVCEDCEQGLVACDAPATGTYPASTCVSPRGSGLDLYAFDVTADEPSVVIDLVSAEYDTYLYVFDDNCTEVARDDDGGDGFNSRLTLENLPPGLYYAGIASFAADATGTFDLTLTCSEVPDPVDECDDTCVLGEIVDCDETVTGAFPQSTCVSPRGNPVDFYTFEMPEEPDLEVVLDLSGDYDTYLHLYDENCILIAGDDDGGPGLNSRLNLSDLALPPGTYYAGASSFSNAGAGTFELTLTCREPPPPPQDITCDEPCVVGDIACDDAAVTGPFPQSSCVRLDDDRWVDFYALSIDEGSERVNISLTGDFDTYLFVYDAGCNQVAFNDDGGEGLNSFLTTDLPAGEYFVGVSSFARGGTAAGTFNLEVFCGDAPDLCSDDCILASVSCGEIYSDAFPQSRCTRSSGQPLDFYEIITTAGPLVVNLTGDYDTYLQLYDGNCNLLAEDDDGGEGLNSRLEVDVGEGVYYLGVSSYSSGGRGTFNLEAACAGGESFCIQCRTGAIRPGDTAMSTFPGTECTLPDGFAVDAWGFNLSEPFSGTITVESAAFDTTLALFDRRCDEIDFNDDCDASTDSCLEVDLEPGPYTIVVSSGNIDETGDYVLRVRATSAGQVFSRGDVVPDGRLGIDDAVRVFGWLFQGADTPTCLETADANNSGGVDLTDGVVILNYLFTGGPPPAAPGPPGVGTGCATDTDLPGSPGDLGCESYPGCTVR